MNEGGVHLTPEDMGFVRDYIRACEEAPAEGDGGWEYTAETYQKYATAKGWIDGQEVVRDKEQEMSEFEEKMLRLGIDLRDAEIFEGI